MPLKNEQPTGRLRASPIPTRFDKTDNEFIRYVAEKTGLSRSEVIRRCVRIMGLELARRGAGWDWVEQTAHALPPVKTIASGTAVQQVLGAEDLRRSQSKRARKRS